MIAATSYTDEECQEILVDSGKKCFWLVDHCYESCKMTLCYL